MNSFAIARASAENNAEIETIELTPQELEDAYFAQQHIFAKEDALSKIDNFLELNDIDPELMLPDTFRNWAETISVELADKFLSKQCSDTPDNETWDEVVTGAMEPYLKNNWGRTIVDIGKTGNLDYTKLSQLVGTRTNNPDLHLTRKDFLEQEDFVLNQLVNACTSWDLMDFLSNTVWEPSETNTIPAFENKLSIVTEDRDGLDVRMNNYMFLTMFTNTDDLLAAIKDACVEYCRTPEGRQVYEQNNNCFNFGDLDVYVPDAICKKHGFLRYSTTEPEVRDFNEQLVTEFDVFGDEDDGPAEA